MHYLKAKLALLAIAVIWGSLIIRDLPSLIIAYRHDRNTNRKTKDGRFYSILIAQDCYVNALLGGWFKTTISSELGNQAKVSRAGKIAADVVDWLFSLASDFNHCAKSIEAEDKHWFDGKTAIAGFFLWAIGGLIKFVLMVIAVSYFYGVITQ